MTEATDSLRQTGRFALLYTNREGFDRYCPIITVDYYYRLLMRMTFWADFQFEIFRISDFYNNVVENRDENVGCICTIAKILCSYIRFEFFSVSVS